jgi:hypothetical protein
MSEKITRLLGNKDLSEATSGKREREGGER